MDLVEGNMAEQLVLFVPSEIVYEIPGFYSCKYHGDWNPQAVYSEKEIIRDLDEQGFVDCPYCLSEIVGIEGV